MMENTQDIPNENKGLDRIAKLLEDYQKETSNTYDKVQRFRLYGKIRNEWKISC
jgi:hypothetical protein